MALATALAPVAASFELVLHGHKMSLADVPAGERVLFIVRDPVARYVSGFNSRLRMGRPRLDRPWNTRETKAFARFKTPNELAEALARRDAEALAAMDGIRHVNRPLSAWVVSRDCVRARLPDIVWIGLTDALADDFEEIKRRLGLPPALALPQDDVGSHRTPEGFSTGLSETGRRAIAHWYAEDIALFEFLKEQRRHLASTPANAPG